MVTNITSTSTFSTSFNAYNATNAIVATNITSTSTFSTSFNASNATNAIVAVAAAPAADDGLPWRFWLVMIVVILIVLYACFVFTLSLILKKCYPESPEAQHVDGAKDELQCNNQYWSNTSASSPWHVLRTVPHAVVALVGMCGTGCFCLALIEQKPFDASLAAALVLLCVHVYALQSEHRRRKSISKQDCQGISVHSGEPRSCNAAAAEGTSELDLTGYARTLGVNVHSGAVVQKKGGTLNKILLDALAKEYLRCNSALRLYQSTFGPLKKDTPEEVEQGSKRECGLSQDDEPTQREAAESVVSSGAPCVESPSKNDVLNFIAKLDLTQALTPERQNLNNANKDYAVSQPQPSHRSTVSLGSSLASSCSASTAGPSHAAEDCPQRNDNVSPSHMLQRWLPPEDSPNDDVISERQSGNASFGIFGRRG